MAKTNSAIRLCGNKIHGKCLYIMEHMIRNSLFLYILELRQNFLKIVCYARREEIWRLLKTASKLAPETKPRVINLLFEAFLVYYQVAPSSREEFNVSYLHIGYQSINEIKFGTSVDWNTINNRIIQPKGCKISRVILIQV